MRAIGIEYLVASDADPVVVANVLAEAVQASEARGRIHRPALHRARCSAIPRSRWRCRPDPRRRRPRSSRTARERSSRSGVRPARPGARRLRSRSADEIARLGAHTLLVDADVYGGTVAASLGLLDESPGLAAACRQAASSRLDAAALARSCWQLNPRLRVLTGLTLAARWTELRPPAVTAVLGAARRLAEFTVVDCGFCLETDEELSFDTVAPRRNGATLAVLDAADVVLVVGAADPIGMQRLVRGLARTARRRDRGAGAGRAEPGPHGERFPATRRSNWRAPSQQFAGHAPSALLPYDRESCRRSAGRRPRAGREPPGRPAAHCRRRPRRRAVRPSGRDPASPAAVTAAPCRRVTQRRGAFGLRGSNDSVRLSTGRAATADERATLARRRRVLLPRDAAHAAARRRAGRVRAAARRVRLRAADPPDRGADLARAALPAADAHRARAGWRIRCGSTTRPSTSATTSGARRCRTRAATSSCWTSARASRHACSTGRGRCGRCTSSRVSPTTGSRS